MVFAKKQFKKKTKPQKREISDIEQKLIDLRRVSRTMAGGRRFSFRATMVVGNRKGEVGIGTGKGADTAIAIEKAVRRGKKNMIKIPLTKEGTIPHEAWGKFGGTEILLRPATKGRGLVSGSSVRTVLDLGGVKNATSKVLSRSKNKLNNAHATIKAINKLKIRNKEAKTTIKN